jgi:hypothetical protein
MLGHHAGVDAAAHVPVGADAGITRGGGLDDVVEDRVGHLFVERAFVAVAPHVHLQALQFHAELVGHDLDRELGEIGLAGERAQAGEFGDLEADQVVALRRRVAEGVQVLRRGRRRIGRQRSLIRRRFWIRLGAAFGHGIGCVWIRGWQGARCYHPATN